MDNLFRIFVPPSEAAHMLSISRASLYAMIKRKELRITKLGRRSLIRVTDLLAFGTDASQTVGVAQ
ncbi:MAG: helix-turn-helix domain-containing protein [Aestuariivirga sp.]